MLRNSAILGGSKTLNSDIDILSGNEIIIQCNHHYGKTPDYICFIDDISQNPTEHPLNTAIANKPTKCSTVSIRPGQADIIYHQYRALCIADTGQLAVRFAIDNFDGVVYLCGFNLRQDHPNPHKRANMIDRWTTFLNHLGRDIDRLQPVTGPLAHLIRKKTLTLALKSDNYCHSDTFCQHIHNGQHNGP